MTNPTSPEQHLLVILGEVRGDVKATLRRQEEFSARLTELEERLGYRIKEVEQENRSRTENLETRVASLEAIRLKVAGVALALGAIASTSPIALKIIEKGIW